MRLLNQMLNLNIPLFKPKSGQRTFFYRTIRFWNSFFAFFKVSVSVVILVNIYFLFSFLNFFIKDFIIVIFRFTIVSTLVIIIVI